MKMEKTNMNAETIKVHSKNCKLGWKDLIPFLSTAWLPVTVNLNSDLSWFQVMEEKGHHFTVAGGSSAYMVVSSQSLQTEDIHMLFQTISQTMNWMNLLKIQLIWIHFLALSQACVFPLLGKGQMEILSNWTITILFYILWLTGNHILECCL